MNLNLIAGHLQANACGTAGVTIFVNEMPSSCGEGTLLLDAYSGTKIDNELPDYFSTEFRIITRSVNYDSGMALAKKTASTIKSVTGYVLGTMTIKRALPVNLPRAYRKSIAGYWEFEVDMEIVFVDTAP